MAKFLQILKELTSEEITQGNIEHSELWLIQYKMETKGPYHYGNIDEIIDTHSNDLADCLVCNLKEKKWSLFFEHPSFQKRKKGSVSPLFKKEELRGEQYLLLAAGIKSGPLSVDQVLAKINTKTITMNNLLSSDNGKSWRKVYHFPHFDRRKFDELSVQKPDDEHFEKSRVYTSQYLKKLNLQNDKESSSSLEEALKLCKEHLTTQKLSSLSLLKVDQENYSFIKRYAFVILLLLFTPLMFFQFSGDQKSSTNSKEASRDTSSTKDQVTSPTVEETKYDQSKSTRTNYSDRNRPKFKNDELDISATPRKVIPTLPEEPEYNPVEPRNDPKSRNARNRNKRPGRRQQESEEPLDGPNIDAPAGDYDVDSDEYYGMDDEELDGPDLDLPGRSLSSEGAEEFFENRNDNEFENGIEDF